ncbi:autorepressor SdpR family transcription factor [Allosphingosinicella sp.]|jgi:DNA-binding transcriptional ArsR family regulator|uniref:autorepressor SdpR family transcription factor n=1 Tax=Allosphingosinicella sp. TaxID=2823234 RepID=UPI002EE6B086
MNRVFEALAHPTRREILEMLKSGSKTAGEIADAFRVSKPTMSGHFAKLKEAGLIQADQQGTTIFYSINLSTLEEVLLGFMGRIGVAEGKQGPDRAAKGERA